MVCGICNNSCVCVSLALAFLDISRKTNHNRYKYETVKRSKRYMEEVVDFYNCRNVCVRKRGAEYNGTGNFKIFTRYKNTTI